MLAIEMLLVIILLDLKKKTTNIWLLSHFVTLMQGNNGDKSN